jgi:ABC-type nitrate/sulfonate/bicarbonate transport system permease component
MRISMGIAWLVIVAAEMLVGGTGIGYFVWNEWNNLSLTNVIFAILVIGVVGMLLDLMFARLQRASPTWSEAPCQRSIPVHPGAVEDLTLAPAPANPPRSSKT